MTCGFCGSRNGDGEHRCRRCGRRPDDTLNGEYALRRTRGPLAVAMEPSRGAEERPRKNFARAVQVPLFQYRPAPNVIPFEAYAAVEPAPVHRSRPRPAAPRPARRRVAEGQGSLDFLPPAPLQPRTLPTTVEAVIFCDAPVAARLHRAVAAGLDGSLILIAYGIFLLAFYALGGRFAFNRTSLFLMAGVLPLFGMVYGLMWCWAGREPAGMQWARLRLLTFEGFPPDRRQLLERFAGSCLSCFTVLGWAWSLLDEESLGWQDHISRTFPTPMALDDEVLRRR